MNPSFHPLLRGLHWLMALLILSMLFIGVGMISDLSPRHTLLVSVHKLVGLALLVLVLIRIGVRMCVGSPALPSDLPPAQRWAAKASHLVLYGMMLAMPLLGWGMLSAGGYPLPLQLPALLPQDIRVYAVLRQAHGWLAYLLFATVLLHLAAALVHGLIRRDGVLRSMWSGRVN
ncbi:cytochrome b/b6 domain-containing protein [Pseudomonas sp. AL 58]|uniref:cytochrome b n=1 Tax=Pseudomonas sp. AL 58 TaxID=3104275 RepID=UPI002EC01046|nr:cytochrome b/b6 domain-containing protein [Pseudomonas sp. AL 58]